MLNPSPVHLKIGSHLGKYRILRELGEGPLAHVYVADDSILYRQVALKVLKPEFARQGPPSESIEEEVNSAAVLLHSGIVPLYCSGYDSGHHYFTMALMPNGNLRDAILGGLSTRQALTIIGQIARALSFAHSKGVAHQGIKPENILFRKDGSAVLADFLAMKVHGFGVGVLTRDIPADPRYFSPEDIQNSGRHFGRADLYALGMVLFEMLTGQTPFQSEDILWQHVNSPVPRLPAHLSDYQFLIDKLLAKRPTDRFDANQLIQSANRLLSQEPAASAAAKVTVLPVRGKMKPARKPSREESPEPKRGMPSSAPPPIPPEPSELLAAEAPAQETSLPTPAAMEVPNEGSPPADGRRPRRPALLLGGFLLLGAAAAVHLLLSDPQSPGAPLPPPASDTRQASPAAAFDLEQALQLWQAAEVEARKDFAEATASIHSGDGAAAESILQGLRQRFPQLPEPYNNLAVIRAAEGRLDAAQDLIEDGMRAHPSYAVLLENLNSVQLEKSLNTGISGETPPQLLLLPVLSPPFSPLALPPAPAPSRAPESPPAAAVASEAAPPAVRSAAVDLLDRWTQAWSAQDLEAYLGFYGGGFQPDGAATRAGWEDQRRQALRRPAWIKVALEEIHVSRQEEDMLRVVAVQDYRSDRYRDRTLKGFILGRQDDAWRILREESLGTFR